MIVTEYLTSLISRCC